ncbi:hypothetical protein GQ43DRAFT_437217 [Delitschia confertaspora ATCC 74209]|uniref:Uncharacterized protein n=1 Tax=Delitschia confertaspora ATCC 74209 TaxID=1513339 RepID=A0A9P4MZD4_9PLEO|nr:hypothetical protein GQ43DRAFT_437217 [Delitschia confertaspora ATCC 74209]
MTYYDSRYHTRRHDPYYSRSQEPERYSSLNQNGYEYDYDARYSHYTANPPLAQRSSPYSPPPVPPSRHQWPPPPSVEDEMDALAKEFPSAISLDDESSGEVQSRGSVDQIPIIEDVERPPPEYFNDERRYVLVSDPKNQYASSSNGSPARDGRRRSFAERGNMAYLKTDMDDPPVFMGRTPTPYAYTKPIKESTAPSAGEYYLSPEPITPTGLNTPRSIPRPDRYDAQRDQNARPSKPSHDRYDPRPQSPLPSRNDAFGDSDAEAEDTARLRAERKPARYSFVKNDLQKEDLRINLKDTKRDRRDSRPPARSSPKSPRDYSFHDSSGSSKHSTPPASSPRSSASSLHNGHASHQSYSANVAFSQNLTNEPTRHPDSRPRTRPSSPFARDGRASPSSPHLSRESSWRAQERPRSPLRPNDFSPPPRPSSMGGSRPHTPSSHPRDPTQIAIREHDWYTTYPPVPKDRSRPPSRYGRHDTVPIPTAPRIGVQSPSPGRPPYTASPPTTSPLPYPLDDSYSAAFMPPEEAYQVLPSHHLPPHNHSFGQSYAEAPMMPSSPVLESLREKHPSFRSPISKSYAVVGEVPNLMRSDSYPVRSHSRNDMRQPEHKQPSLDKPLPACPRTEPVGKYNDWYTLDGCSNFDICPTCFDGVFAQTTFAHFFSQSRLYEAPVARICDFSDAWVRMAWLLTVKQRRVSPDLLYRLADIADKEEQCPAEREVAGPWYGIADHRDGVHISNFVICPRDLRQLEALLPSLRGYFTKVPSDPRNPKLHKCSLRTTYRRFPKYLDPLVNIHEESMRTRSAPNMSPFIDLVREHAYRKECDKDKPTIGKPWHFIPDLPEFTVCEECYNDVIWPEIKKGSNLASKFNRTLQLIPYEDSEGSSCCLYGPRMRVIFARALEEDDFGYLKRKAIERKQARKKLARERVGLLRIVDGKGRSQYSSAEWESFRRTLRAVDAEWKEWD